MTDFIVANFSGTGDLTAYSPDTGSAFTAPSTADILTGTFGHGLSATAMLAYMTRASAGSVQQVRANPWGDSYLLYNPTVPSSADYYMETTALLDPGATQNLYVAHCMRGIRGSGGEAAYFDAIGIVFNVDETDATHRKVSSIFGNYSNDRGVSPSITIDNEVNVVALPIALGAAASVVLRSEIEGNSMRAFVDDVLVYTCDFTDSGYFASANKCAWAFQFSGGGTNSNEAIDKLAAGDTFVVITPPASAFWTNFVQSSETF